MKKFQEKRLLALADFLEKLPPERFDFSQIAFEDEMTMAKALKEKGVSCNTVGCAIGWMPARFPKLVRWNKLLGFDTIRVESKKSGALDFRVAQEIFGLDMQEAQYLFNPGGYGNEYEGMPNELYAQTTSKEVAEHIRNFVASYER